ncbi:MAG: hypothetical protein DRO67_05345, partial [Candidatus Asgardarchaeum californiense]
YTIYLRAGNSTLGPSHVQGYTNNTTSYSISTTWSTTYYWKIVATDEHNASTEGPIWHFTTGDEESGGPGGGGPPGGGNTGPTADANGPYTGYVNQSITFDGSGSSDSDGSIAGYMWDFDNDGTYDTGWLTTATTTHSYSVAGNYTVKLKVKDNLDSTDIDTTYANISELPEEKEPPIADANGPYSGLTFQNITFDGSDSYDPDGNIVNYTWNFGDNTTGYGASPMHIYNLSGIYIVTLTVTDDDGLTDSDTTNATILLDSDGDGWSDDMEDAYGTNASDPNDQIIDTDNDGIPDNDSSDGSYAGDPDDDNDGLNDDVEEMLGSDPKNDSDVENIGDAIENSYLIDIDGDGQYDKYYNSTSGINTTVEIRTDGQYLIDVDGDGNWDYIYDPALNMVSPYEKNKETEPPWIIIVIGIIIGIVVIILLVLFKMGYLYIEDIPIEKKSKEEIKTKKQSRRKKK